MILERIRDYSLETVDSDVVFDNRCESPAPNVSISRVRSSIGDTPVCGTEFAGSQVFQCHEACTYKLSLRARKLFADTKRVIEPGMRNVTDVLVITLPGSQCPRLDRVTVLLGRVTFYNRITIITSIGESYIRENRTSSFANAMCTRGSHENYNDPSRVHCRRWKLSTRG